MAKPNLRYPLQNISQSDDFLKIESFKYTPPGLNLSGNTFAQRSSDDVGYGSPSSQRNSNTSNASDSIQDSNGASWGAGNMGPLQTATMGAAMEVVEVKIF
jgi:hypothetical protein